MKGKAVLLPVKDKKEGSKHVLFGVWTSLLSVDH